MSGYLVPTPADGTLGGRLRGVASLEEVSLGAGFAVLNDVHIPDVLSASCSRSIIENLSCSRCLAFAPPSWTLTL